MNLRVTGVGKERPFFIGAIGCGDIAAARVGREIEYISIATGREDDGIARVRFDPSRNQTPRDNPFGVPVEPEVKRIFATVCGGRSRARRNTVSSAGVSTFPAAIWRQSA